MKEMAVTRGEYALSKAALKKGLSRPTRRVGTEEIFGEGLKVTSASGRLPT